MAVIAQWISFPDDPDNYLCPHCGYRIDPEADDIEEATVGSLFSGRPHYVCPGCKECMACLKRDET